jgi:hypothetical protein
VTQYISYQIIYRLLLTSTMLALNLISNASAQTTAFTYQGRLNDSGNPATGQYDLQFKLFDALSGGIQQGTTQTATNITVTNGIFAVTLDFGACPACFDGAARFLEIAVKPGGSGSFTTLTPRQQITSTPYALKSQNAAVADGLSVACVNCITGSQIQNINGSTVTGTIPVASVPAGSANYVQNGISQQAATNFNISGSGTANIFDAQTQFNLGGSRVLSRPGTNNFFAGVNAGASNSTGTNNSFFGINAGFSNTTGGSHSFFGANAGLLNNAVCCNSFFGTFAGTNNTTGSSNSFFGAFVGENNSTGLQNSFFGTNTGQANTTGQTNSFFGTFAGNHNTTGGGNSFFGSSAGFANTTGSSNVFLGGSTGTHNITGNNITLIGIAADVGADNLNFATAIGAMSVVSTSNTVVLGRNADTVKIPGVLNITGGIDANSVNVTTQYNIGGSRILSNAGSFNLFAGVSAGQSNTTGGSNSFFGPQAGNQNTTGNSNSFFGVNAGFNNTTSNFNAFFGINAGLSNTTGSSNTFIGANAGNLNASTQVNNSTAIGVGTKVSTSNTIVLGTSAETTLIPGLLNAGNGAMRVVSSSIGGGVVGENLYIHQLNQPAALPHLCWMVAPDGVQGLLITTCTSSAAPSSYKTDLQTYTDGLEVIKRLQPMSFAWKEGGGRDFGLSAEAVAEVAPLMVTRNAKGEAEDVKHENLNALFINAFKEQQSQIITQQQQIKQHQSQLEKQQSLIDALRKLACLDHPGSDLCR